MRSPTHQAINELSRALHGSDLNKQEYIRVHAVLLTKKGYTRKQVVDITEKSADAVDEWVTAYHRHGIAGLMTKPRESSATAKLTRQRKAEITSLITGHKPTEYGYSGDFWSIQTLKRLIKDRYEVEYENDRSYRRLLKECGFSYQKAEYVDHRKDETAPKEFKVRLRKRLKKGAFSMSW